MQICEEYTPAEVVGANDLRTRFRTVKNEISIMKQKNDELHKLNYKKIEDLDQKVIDALAKIETAFGGDWKKAWASESAVAGGRQLR